MKRFLLVNLMICFVIALAAQTNLSKINPTQRLNEPELIFSDRKTTVLKLSLRNYGFDNVLTPRGLSNIVDAPGSSFILEKDAPELPKFTASILIPDMSEMEVVIKSSSYIDYYGIEIAPSKGHLFRNVKPEDVPFEYGPVYYNDAFYPEYLAKLDDPYVLRDFAGQALQFYPFQYNPVSKTLRVYTELVVEVKEKSTQRQLNPLYRTNPLNSVVREFHHIYERHFINYKSIESVLYTPLEEYGRMLVICHPPYMDAMAPFVAWKNTIGIPTKIVDVSTIGGVNPTQVKSYIQSYYDSTDLAFVLLVGDNMHIAPFPNSTPGITGPSDNAYAYLAGNDRYPDVFIGRFSAESIAHVETQVNRTLAYEKAQNLGVGWLNISMGVARNEGAGMGHNGESDCQHMDLIRNRLLTYNYTTVHQEYDQGCTGVPNTNAATISNKINQGVGMINYCNHGSANSWSVANYSSTHVNALTNNNKWPFIWSVACVNGEFVNQTCFAEVWLRATNNGQPSGALATLMSTINQSWHPPMDAQDEFNDILIGSYANNIKRTFGGISFNGMFKMNDINGTAGFQMTDTWNLFGDPSVKIRTDDPLAMTVTHPVSIMIQETSLAVNCNVNAAFVALSVNGQVIGTGHVAGGVANVSFTQLTVTDSITVAVTAYNRIPYIGKVAVLDFLYNVDAGVSNILKPETHYICDNISVQPKIVIRNNGFNNLNSVRINYRLNNGPVTQYNWTGSLPSLQRDTIMLPAFTLQQGAHTFQAYTTLPNGVADQNSANDSRTINIVVEDLQLSADFIASSTSFCSTPATVSFTNLSQNGLTYHWDFGDGQTSTQSNPVHSYDVLGVYTVTLVADAGICGQEVKTEAAYINVGLEMPQVVPASSCGQASLTLEANGTGTINWYNDAAGNNLIHTGNTYVTPLLTSTTNYYVRSEATHTPDFGGRPDNSGSGGFFGNIQHQHFLIFDAYTPFKLMSVKVYAGSAGSRTVSIRDAYGDIIQSATAYLPAGESRMTLDFDVPVGTNLRLQGDGNPDLFRNNNNTATFPYTMPGIFSITETSASLPAYNVTGNYYYFYDWEVKEEDCFSAMQTVTASILYNPTASFMHNVNGTVATFLNNSQYGTSYHWDFGDGNQSTQQNPTHVYASVGTFNVVLTVTNNCGSDTYTTTVTTSMAAPLTDFYGDNLVINEGDFVNFFDISANVPNDWHWIFEGGTPSMSSVKNPTVQYNSAGVFYVTLVSSNPYGTNFMNKPNYITVLTTSIDEKAKDVDFIILYPNPTQSGYMDYSITLDKPAVVNISIYDALGALVKIVADNELFEKGNNQGRINLSHLSAGFYYLSLSYNDIITTRKIVISK